MAILKLKLNRGQLIVLFSCIMYFFFYLCRLNYPLAIPFIKQAFNVTSAQVGGIATALTLGYAIGQFVNGYLVDNFGARVMTSVGAVGSMVANLLMGGSPLFDLLILFWFLNGYFQSMGYPPTLRLVVNWLPENERGRALGVSESLQSAASLIILPLAGWLALHLGWRYIFFVPAVALGVMGQVSAFAIRDSPEIKPKRVFLNPFTAYRQALGNWRLFGAYLSYGGCTFLRYAIITWIPSYLFEVSGMSIFKSALIAMTFQIGGILGSPLVGALADRWLKKHSLIIAVGIALSGMAAMALAIVPPTSGWGIVAVLMIAGMGIEALEVAYFLIPTEYLGQSFSATGAGCMNATGKLIGSFQGVSLGFLIDRFGYGSAFGFAGLFGILAAALVLPSGWRKHVPAQG